jgi:AraC-like DNA-binding protein
MTQMHRLSRATKLILRDLGVSPSAVMRRVGLPDDFLSRDRLMVTTDQCFGLWEAIAEEAEREDLGLYIGQSVSAEMFEPALFAGLCSPDLQTAAERLAIYKRTLGPLTMTVDHDAEGMRLGFGSLSRPELPRELGTMEVSFWVKFAKMATRTPIKAQAVGLPYVPTNLDAYTEVFGCTPELSDGYSIRFSELDARRPFLTADASMWRFFEPELRQRLAELDESATTAERVRNALFELLPSGRGAIADVGRKLGMSSRTLQRRLKSEGVRFQEILGQTREQLARHYLTSTDMPGAEISFLLGFEDPSSFVRAFREWTGETPETVRAASRRRTAAN